MTNVNFDYTLPSGTTINVEAEIVSEGTAPVYGEHAEQGESPEVEIVGCYVISGVPFSELIEIDLTGLWFRKYKSTTLIEVTEHIMDMAWAKYEESK